MQVTEERFPDGFLIVPNLEYFFGEFRNEENCLDIVETFSFQNVAEIHLARLGAIAFRFLDGGPLQSIPRYRTSGSGIVPDHVMENHDRIVELQGRRLIFANFIAAALFGRLSAMRHSSLSGAQYVGMAEILGFERSGRELRIEQSWHSDDAITPKVRLARGKPTHIKIATPDEIAGMVEFVAHLSERQTEFEHADLQTCMVMNYQAAILHNEQHSAASLALNFSVAEALIQEIFFAYGIVGDRTPNQFATRNHSVPEISRNQFSRLNLERKIAALSDGGLIEPYLGQRLNEARILRNHLMHRAAVVTVVQSGNMQTTVRDLWSYLIDGPFELATAWSMRL